MNSSQPAFIAQEITQELQSQTIIDVARSMNDLQDIMHKLKAKGVALRATELRAAVGTQQYVRREGASGTALVATMSVAHHPKRGWRR